MWTDPLADSSSMPSQCSWFFGQTEFLSALLSSVPAALYNTSFHPFPVTVHSPGMPPWLPCHHGFLAVGYVAIPPCSLVLCTQLCQWHVLYSKLKEAF